MKPLLALVAATSFAAWMLPEATAIPSAPRDVMIERSSGGRLAATYYDPGRSGAAILIFNNCDQRRSSVDRFARKLAARGLHVVAYDYAEGSVPPGKSWQTSRSDDAEDVLRWLTAQPGVDATHVVAVGGSCGSALALDFAAAHLRESRGVVVLSSGPPDSTMTALLARAPMLAILGGASRVEGSEPNVNALVKSSSNPASRLVVVPAGHGTEMLKDSAELETIVLDWIAARTVSSAPASVRNR